MVYAAFMALNWKNKILGKFLFSLGDYWKYLVCLCFSGKKVKGGEWNAWEEAYNGNTILLYEAVRRNSWSCQGLFVLSSKILISLLHNLARKAAF